jgi:hypothetical protein
MNLTLVGLPGGGHECAARLSYTATDPRALVNLLKLLVTEGILAM